MTISKKILAYPHRSLKLRGTGLVAPVSTSGNSGIPKIGIKIPTAAEIEKIVGSKTTVSPGKSVVSMCFKASDSTRPFLELRQQLADLFPRSFVVQTHLHTTILSTHLSDLDRATLPSDAPTPEFNQQAFSEVLNSFSDEPIHGQLMGVSFDATPRVYFSCPDTRLKDFRTQLIRHGAQAKQGAIQGDFINRSTIVLGYFQTPSDFNDQTTEVVSKLLSDWVHQYGHLQLNIGEVHWVEHDTTSLETYRVLNP